MAWTEKAQEIKALVEEGVVMAVVEGEGAAKKAIDDPEGPFARGEFYLFAGPLDRVSLSAHPYKAELRDADLSTLRDAQGNFFVFEFMKIVLRDGAGWHSYLWPKPGAEEPSRKVSYIMKVPGKDLYIGGGFYEE